MQVGRFIQGRKSHNESLRNDRLNDLLSKISDGKELSQSEKNFLDNFDMIKEEDLRDYTLLNCSDTYRRVSDLLDNNKTVNFQGKEVQEIKYIKDDICVITHSDIIKLKDNCLYNITSNDDDSYTISIHDEYYEKLPLSND